MKKIKVSKLLIVALAAFLFNNINASCETITGKYIQGDYADLGVDHGLVPTHKMKFQTDDGRYYNAFCAWSENTAPNTVDRITLESISMPKNHAMAVAGIINDTEITSGLNETEIQVVKTTALNLYLSINGILAEKKYNNNKTDLANANRFDNSKFNRDRLIMQYSDNLPGFVNYISTSGNKYHQAVYKLYNKAIGIRDSYSQPYLKFANNNSDFELISGYYTKTYKLESNVGLESITPVVEGVASSYVITTSNINNKTVTIKIKEEAFTQQSNIKVKINAKIVYKEAFIYVNKGQDRMDFQDLVIADLGTKNITVSTEDKISAKRCFRYNTACDTTACEKTNANNARTCNSVVEEYWALNCGQDDAGNNQYGRKTIELSAGCNLYCTETATASYPGNVRPAITLGTNLEWPTGANGIYPLTTNATLTCKVVASPGINAQTCLQQARDARYVYTGNDAVAKVSYNDTKETKTISLESTCNTNYSVNGDNVVIQNSCGYTLPKNKNIAISKETIAFVNQISSELSSAVTNYILITKYNGVLPIGGTSWTDSTNISEVLFDKKYNLEILNLPLGYGGEFTANLNTTPYVCNYQVTTIIGGECICPPGTEWSGTDLYGAMKNEAKTCAEAKEIYCNRDNLTCRKPDGTTVDITSCVQSKKDIEACEKEVGCEDSNKKVCPTTTTYAGYAYEMDRRYKACISGGGTEEFCMNLVCDCEDGNCEYTCPAGTDHAGMDISTCIYEQRGNGKNLVQAQEYCWKQCNGGASNGGLGNGRIIIYRTISLENPFPSKDADRIVTQTGLSRGMFNDVIKGRYPGTNWNSVTLVYNKIRNNRGYDGSAIYNEATPLYTINLDAKSIKQIREYNKKQIDTDKGGYADFELTCTDGAYCISRFLHNSGITNADGSSILDVSNSTCGRASDKPSFISCYTYK